MKLEIGKTYKIKFNDKFFIGKYEGIYYEDHACIPCLICKEENHKRGHQFNSYYDDSDMAYETFYIGTTCINKCKIEESTWQEMINT